jgi:hypothetical protein
MLRKSPEQRYQNVGLVARDLTIFGSENRSTLNVKPARITQKQQIVVPKLISMTSTKLYSLFAITGLLAAIMAGSSVYLINHEQSNAASQAQTVSKPIAAADTEQSAPSSDLFENAASKTKADAKLLEAVPPIQEVDVIKDHKKQHKYEFPDISLGRIYYTSSTVGEYFNYARQTVYLPVDQSFGFKICGPEAFAMFLAPSIFKKIPGRDFKTLIFGIPTDGNSRLVATDKQQSAEMMEKSVATALQNLDGWTNLETLFVGSCKLNKDALGAFNNFKKLNALTLDKCELNPETLAKQPFLQKLKGFYLQKSKFDVNPVINQVGTSSSLQRLAVDSPISVENLHKLQSCSQLEFLQLAQNDIDDAGIAEICGMKKLKTLHLFHMVLSDKQVMRLTKCAWLTEILLSQEFKYGDAAPRIEAMDPRIKFAGE